MFVIAACTETIKIGPTIERISIHIKGLAHKVRYHFSNVTFEVDENLSFNDNVIPYIMDNTYSIDIDTIEDLQLARQKLKSL